MEWSLRVKGVQTGVFRLLRYYVTAAIVPAASKGGHFASFSFESGRVDVTTSCDVSDLSWSNAKLEAKTIRVKCPNSLHGHYCRIRIVHAVQFRLTFTAYTDLTLMRRTEVYSKGISKYYDRLLIRPSVVTRP